jgi:hypothetical protein
MPKYWGARGVIETLFGLLVMRGTIPLAELAFSQASSQLPPNEEAVENEKSSD